jgi:hypothetical protein
MGRFTVRDAWGIIASDAQVTYRSSGEEKLWVAKQALELLRAQLESFGLEHDGRYIIYTRLVSSSYYCDDCHQNEWRWTLAVINVEDDSSAIVDAWWHGEANVQVRLRGVLPHRGETSTSLLTRVLEML